MKFNKKAQLGIGLFAFFFGIMIFSGLILLFGVGLHMIFYSYAIEPTLDIAEDSLGLNSSGSALTNANQLASDFYDFYGFYDILFFVLILGMFVQSCISAARFEKENPWSFFGLVTIGNVLLILIMNFAIQIRGWIVNDVFYTIISAPVSTPVMTTFFNYSYYIGLGWFLILLIINQVDWAEVLTRLPFQKQSRGEFEE